MMRVSAPATPPLAPLSTSSLSVSPGGKRISFSKTFSKYFDQDSADDMYMCLTRPLLDIWRTVVAEIERFRTVRSAGRKRLPHDGSY